jgi:spore germination protein YaaH
MRHLVKVSIVAASLLAVTLGLSQPQALKTTGWMVFWNPDSMASFEKNAGQIDEVKPEWIRMDAEGMPVKRDIEPAAQEKFFEIAKKHKITTLAMISNFASEAGGFEATRVQKMLKTKESRARHINALTKILKADGFDGVDLDIESLKASDRDSYSLYVEELGKVLKREKLSMAVTVHPKESEPGAWDGPQAQDWARLGKAADAFKIMCYDHAWSGSPAGPIAPTAWVERVMTFAKSVIPASKLDMGVAAYGYDWSVKPTLSTKWKDWVDKDKEATTCPLSGERINGDRYFSGAKAFEDKKKLAQKLGIRGLAVWYFGSEDPAIWGK